MSRTRVINDIGIGMAGEHGEKIADLRVYPENAAVQVWITLSDGTEAMQYLTCLDAMAFAKAFERCAIQALKDSAP